MKFLITYINSDNKKEKQAKPRYSQNLFSGCTLCNKKHEVKRVKNPMKYAKKTKSRFAIIKASINPP